MFDISHSVANVFGLCVKLFEVVLTSRAHSVSCLTGSGQFTGEISLWLQSRLVSS